MSRISLFEIQTCKITMVFFSSEVIGAGGGDFVFEIAEVDSFSVANDGGAPEVFLLIEANAFVS